ncbi:hypothetical protein AGMMS50212_07530 [Spirochaetia bacterium]|nr:hypothetical protein AGMMS50212_07530 [Spirochaetia bacterium]
MTIDRVGPLDPIQPGKSGNRIGHVEKKSSGDSVNISAEARQKADFLHAFEIVSAAPVPGVRADRIAELKAKINDPAYITETVLNGTVDSIIDTLFPNSGSGALTL